MAFKFCTNVWGLMRLDLLRICKSARKELNFWGLIPHLVSQNMLTLCQINSINESTSVLVQSASEFGVKKNWKNAYIGL